MKERIRATWDRLRASYWFTPAVMVAGSILLAMAMERIDEDYRGKALQAQGWIYSGGAEGARAVLSTIAGSIITVAGTTFSITIAVLSLASGQFGPRLLRNFMRDTGNQFVLGTFTSTFLYSILVLRTVRGGDDNVYVPHASVTVGVLMAVFSLAVLIYFIHHTAESIQVSHVIAVVSKDLHAAVHRLFPSGLGRVSAGNAPDPAVDPRAEIRSTGHGYIEAIDADTLVDIAKAENLMFKVLQRPGDYVLPDTPLALSSGTPSPATVADIRSAFTLGRMRTPHQDAAFAFLQIAEIAVRALSPGVNDPFTAIMCIDRITSGMAQFVGRSLPDPIRRDASGIVRVVAHPYSFEDLVHAAYGHIREAARGQSAVMHRLRSQLEYLQTRALDEGLQAAVRRELANVISDEMSIHSSLLHRPS
jgi:uncharacterized membrane protein